MHDYTVLQLLDYASMEIDENFLDALPQEQQHVFISSPPTSVLSCGSGSKVRGGICAADGPLGLGWWSRYLEQLVEKWAILIKKGKHTVRKKLELVSQPQEKYTCSQSIWRVLLVSPLLWAGAIARMLFSLAVMVSFYLEVNNWGNGEETNQLKSKMPAPAVPCAQYHW